MTEYSSKDSVEFALSCNSGKFKEAINQMMSDRIAQAVELKKVDVAANFLSTQEVEPEVTVDEPVAPVEEPEDAETTEV